MGATHRNFVYGHFTEQRYCELLLKTGAEHIGYV